MPSIEVEQPGFLDSRHSLHHPQHFTFDDIELTGSSFRSTPTDEHGQASRRASSSHTPLVIDVDDEDDGVAGPSTSGPPRNRRRTNISSVPMDSDQPVLVIDDMIDNSPVRERRSSTGAQHRPIVILDSDDEQDQPSGSRSAPILNSDSGSRPRRNGVRRRGGRHSSTSFRVFSLSPPPPQHHPIPPVPPLPNPPIIADPRPFAILPPPPNDHAGQNRPHSLFDEPPQPAITRSTNTGGGSGDGPRIHLGGGLFSQGSSTGRARVHFQPYRPEDLDEILEEEPEPRSSGPSSSSAVSRLGRLVASYITSSSARRNFRIDLPARRRPDVNPNGFDFNAAAGPGAGFFNFAAFGVLGPMARRDAALGLGMAYEKSMTHPGRARPGWTYDFGTGADDDQDQENGLGEKAGKNRDVDGSEILVCAHCLDPLLANAEGMVDVSEEERKGRRVWGLRCGHVLDGKCVGVLMRPKEDGEVVQGVAEISNKGRGKDKGKQKLVEPQPQVELESESKTQALERDTDEREVNTLVQGPDVKGKGKAPASAQTPTPDVRTPSRHLNTLSSQVSSNRRHFAAPSARRAHPRSSPSTPRPRPFLPILFHASTNGDQAQARCERKW
ncbi:hypothetical protein K439DRAFT_1612460 [Ramaria rubella]|nr:hypothetical protein K439DRAFT_1612460 [Ramaria rubella]